MRHHHSSIIRGCARLLLLAVALLSAPAARGQGWKQKFTSEKPLIIVGDWDKPPYEFLDRNGEPAGTNIESMALVFKEMGIPFKYVLKDWSLAIKMFELGQADVILANANRYRNGNFAISDNIINYNRICAAMLGDTTGVISNKELLRGGVALKPSDFTTLIFHDLGHDSTQHVEFQPPKVALQGIVAGDYKYFVWGEEPLKWKIRELNLDGIILNDVQIPVSDIYIIGHEKELIEEIDDHFSRLKQSGEIQHIIDKWIHPDRVEKHTSPVIVFIIIGILLLAAFFGLLYKFMPPGKRRYLDQLPGALSAAALWMLLSWAFSLYLNRFGPTSVYGSLATVALSLLWIYWCIAITLLGGVFNIWLSGRRPKKS